MLDKNQIEYLKENLISDGPIVRFLNDNGETVRIEDGYCHPKWENNIHKTYYWGVFSLNSIKKIEGWTGLKAKIQD